LVLQKKLILYSLAHPSPVMGYKGKMPVGSLFQDTALKIPDLLIAAEWAGWVHRE